MTLFQSKIDNMHNNDLSNNLTHYYWEYFPPASIIYQTKHDLDL